MCSHHIIDDTDMNTHLSLAIDGKCAGLWPSWLITRQNCALRVIVFEPVMQMGASMSSLFHIVHTKVFSQLSLDTLK